jgi:hypothetical protein
MTLHLMNTSSPYQSGLVDHCAAWDTSQSIMIVTGGGPDDYEIDYDYPFFSGYLPYNNAWIVFNATTDETPALRQQHGCTLYNGKLYIFGGYDGEYYYNDVSFSTVSAINLNTL